MICGICGKECSGKMYSVPERILNTGESFDYLECEHCGSWTMIDEVNLGDYYPKEYNPYRRSAPAVSVWKKRKILRIFERDYSDFEKVMRMRGVDILIKRLCGVRINQYSKIIDVGCATGHWLDIMAECGFTNLTGVDLFIPIENVKEKKWKFIQGDIFTINPDGEGKKYDLITLHHSLEHMYNPLEVLKKANSLLSDDGYCVISIPLVGGVAHKMFGEYYCQLDAPRHISMMSKNAMKDISDKAGFEVEHISYDSHGLIFSISDGYMNTTKSHSELMVEGGGEVEEISEDKQCKL